MIRASFVSPQDKIMILRKGAKTLAYPKPLSAKSIAKLFSTWDPHTVEVLHTYYEAFAHLYGAIQLKDAWKVFKRFEPKIHKKQFLEFSAIVRREDVPYYIYEINELYSEEKPYDTERYIVNKQILLVGYGKFHHFYNLMDEQAGKPIYALPDFLEAASHRLYDKELRAFLEKMKFTDGEYAGQLFSEAIVVTYDEKFDMAYYAKNKAVLKAINEKANVVLSDKIMRKLMWWTEFAERSPITLLTEFLNKIDYTFESQEQAEQLFDLVAEFINNSHLWRNCGFTPMQLHSIMSRGAKQQPTAISLGPGIHKAVQDGDIDKDDLIRRLKEMGVDVLD